jgi:hypothetical protein
MHLICVDFFLRMISQAVQAFVVCVHVTDDLLRRCVVHEVPSLLLLLD